MEKILIIEDDLWICLSLKLYLENSWFEVYSLNSWENAVEEILSKKYDLIILDINLPVKDWIEICKEVRIKSQIPIVMLTARTSWIDKIIWLEIWADDYILKPFSPRELLARIKNILKRTIFEKQEINNQNVQIDTEKMIVYKWNEKITLTSIEFEIFNKIYNENWKIVTRETLMKDIIWYENYAFDRTIDTHIKNIRKKINISDYIITIRWKGYRLNV